MRQAKLQIFAGTTPKPTRDYLTALFSDLRKRYGRLIVPCVGRFTIPQVAVTFLPLQLAKVEKIGERLAKQMPKDTDHVWLVPDEIAQRFTDILNKVGRYTDIRVMGNIIGRMAEISEEWLDHQLKRDVAEQEAKNEEGQTPRKRGRKAATN